MDFRKIIVEFWVFLRDSWRLNVCSLCNECADSGGAAALYYCTDQQILCDHGSELQLQSEWMGQFDLYYYRCRA